MSGNRVHRSPAEPVTEFPQVPAGPGQGAIPRCYSCGQPMPFHPPLCVCGHPANAHHQTRQAGVLTYCCTGTQAGNCSCGQYEHASDGHYGPRQVTP